MDLARPRPLVEGAAGGLMGRAHRDLSEAYADIGLPEPSEEDEGGRKLVKRERINRSLTALPDDGLPELAERKPRAVATRCCPLGVGIRRGRVV
jgi:hypothetical protein